jgi:hypothetical protein
MNFNINFRGLKSYEAKADGRRVVITELGGKKKHYTFREVKYSDFEEYRKREEYIGDIAYFFENDHLHYY